MSKQVISEIANRQAFMTLLQHNPGLIVIKLGAEWCGPCKMMPPILTQIREKLGDKVRLIKIDVDKNPQLASQLNVSSVPTLAIFHKGQIKWRQSGVQPANTLIQILNQYIES